MEANTTCAICNHTYNSAAKRPLVLPCSHSFCQDCLQRLEAAGDKLCPLCRKTWNNVKIPDLPCCYQLIPVESQNADGASGAVSLKRTCGEHDDDYVIWCQTCNVPLCKKCFRLQHKSCEWVFIDEKENMLQEQQEAELSSRKEKITKYSGYSVGNEEDLAYVQSLMKYLQSLERKLLEYQTDAKVWLAEAQKKLSEPIQRPRTPSKVTDQQHLNEIEELEKKVLTRPSSLLLHVAAAYQSSQEDVGAFVSALQSHVEARRAEGSSCADHQTARAQDAAVSEAVARLNEGGDWVVSDVTSSAAVQRVLQTTSIRPAKLDITSKNIPDKLLIELQAFLDHSKKYPVKVSETVTCFPHSAAPSEETRASTTARLDAWTTPAGWCSLTQFYGHLDAAAVWKLPAATIKSVGLVLRDQEDMAAVNALAATAFGRHSHQIDRSRLTWVGWTDLDLSVARTFLPNYWNLSWLTYTNNGRPAQIVFLPVLATLGVRLRLHLPQLLQEDTPWMLNLFRAMGLDGSGFTDPVPLLLPGIRIALDPLLEVLRNSCQPWEVHLPANLPQLVPREEVAERYKAYGHTITWDLE